MSDFPLIFWSEAGVARSTRWRSENGTPPPKRVQVVDDTIKAEVAYHLACEGTAMLWRGDYHNAKQLLQAIARRIDHKHRKPAKAKPSSALSVAQDFHLHRQAQSQRARTLGMLLLPVEAGHQLTLRRAPDVRQACLEAYGDADEPYVTSLRELQGLIGAHEWRKKGVEIPALESRIHPHYGVFSPLRGEYVELLVKAPLPSLELAFDIGTGTGILAALLARRGVKQIVATDQDDRALHCARENIARLGLDRQVKVMQADLFPEGQAPLIVCNPPWIPARPSSSIEYAIYDPESRMLVGFLRGLVAHLAAAGEGWLILSDIAEHLGLRSRQELLGWIDQAGLKVIDKMDIKPHHPKAGDANDPLHSARAAEITSLWRLAVK